jgi:hypothetical protein
MKNVKLTVSFLLLLTSMLFVNCSPDLPYVSTTKEVITQGTWGVDYYYYGQDKTAQYADYHFTFSTTGNVTVTHGPDTFAGTWSTLKNTSNTDVLTISLDSQEPTLAELNSSWNINTINLASVAMKNSINTQLIFKKL